MAPYNFEGDISNITDRQLEFINEVIKENGFENSKVTFEPVGQAGDNYMASVKRITIEGENGKLSLIAKIAPSHEFLRKMLNTNIVFNNEDRMYNNVLPKFVQLQKDANVPEEEQLKYAKCYGTINEAPHEIILLEDLKTLDYTILDRFESLSDECIKSVLKNFAIYHSLAYALKDKDKATFDQFKSSLIDFWSISEMVKQLTYYFTGIENDTLSILDNPEHVKLAKNKIGGSVELANKLTSVDGNSKYTIILQGDGWTNNLMFKFEEEKLASSIMIDFQLSRVGVPVYDVMYMIFNCTDHEARKEHFYDWIDYYHSELEKSLANFNLKVNYVYPRDKLDADLKRYGKLLFGFSVVLANTLVRKGADAEKMMELMKKEDSVMENVEQFSVAHLDEETRRLYKTKITGLILSFSELGLL